jgi:hypothetical protein
MKWFVETLLLTSLCLLLILVGCTHQIGPLPIEYQAHGERRGARVGLFIAEQTRNYEFVHSRGTDRWKFRVGGTLQDVAQSAVGHEFQDVTMLENSPDEVTPRDVDRIMEIRLVSFEPVVGLFQWSAHEASIHLDVVIRDGTLENLWKGRIQGDSKASGASESLAYVPLVGNLSYDRALRAAMTQAVLDGISQAVSRLESTFQ